MTDRDDALAFVIETPEGERASALEVDPVDWQAGTVEVSFWLHPDHRGAGRAREALSLFVGYAFDDLRAHEVTANAYASNERSRRLLETVGFEEEGVGREDAFVGGAYEDTHYYGPLEPEWRERTDEGDAADADDGDDDAGTDATDRD